jgi:hypothetical protein
MQSYNQNCPHCTVDCAAQIAKLPDASALTLLYEEFIPTPNEFFPSEENTLDMRIG